jgi:transporter family-2 protein
MFISLVLAAGVGFAISTQIAINSQLRQYLNSPIQAAFFSFLVGTLCLAVLFLTEAATRPSMQQLSQIPLWLWVGGLLGVYGVSISLYTAPKLGFLTFTGLVLFGQIVMSMSLDHFGLLGVEKHPLNWQRILGAFFIAIGVLFTLQR